MRIFQKAVYPASSLCRRKKSHGLRVLKANSQEPTCSILPKDAEQGGGGEGRCPMLSRPAAGRPRVFSAPSAPLPTRINGDDTCHPSLLSIVSQNPPLCAIKSQRHFIKEEDTGLGLGEDGMFGFLLMEAGRGRRMEGGKRDQREEGWK